MYYIRLCKAGASICFLAASFFISWSMQPNKCNCFTHTQTNLDCRTAHTLICFARARKKHSQKVMHVFSSCTHTNMLRHTRASRETVLHSSITKCSHRVCSTPSQIQTAIWTHLEDLATRNARTWHAVSLKHTAYMFMHACKNKYACAQFSYWYKECWRSIGFTYVKVWHFL